jgi:sugar (pentulose or hexulose) kinase
MVKALFLGIDLGTTRVKAGLFDRHGNEHSFATVGWGGSARAGAEPGEQDAGAWWTACCAALRQCLQEAGASRVVAACVGGQGPSLVAVDDQGVAVRPAIMYNDRRAEGEAAELSQRLGRPVYVRSSYLPRALWICRHEPQNYAATRWFLQAWDSLVYGLTGVAAATCPLGRYAPWEERDLVAAGLDAARFPAPVQTGQVVGGVSAAASAATGLPAGTPVIAGAGDFMLGTMGTAAARKGVAQSQGGATGAFTLCWDRPLAGEMIAWSIPSPIRPELLNVGGPLTTGGVALDWLLHSALLLPAGYESALARAVCIPPGADGLLFFPYLAGEQLVMSPQVRGMFLGLVLQHTADHLIRAVLEGVAFAGRSIMASLVAAGGRIDEVVTYGGQARSALWNQIKANVWNRPVTVPRVLDAGSVGAAAIAACGAGEFSTLAEASEEMAQVKERYLPDPGQVSLYDAAYAVYAEIYPCTAGLFPRLDALSKDGEE